MNSALETFLAAQKLKQQKFPLGSLLTLYSRSPSSLYLNHLEGFKLLVNWLGPVEKSKLQPVEIPVYFCTYEINCLAEILGEHPSVIYQELYQLWKP